MTACSMTTRSQKRRVDEIEREMKESEDAWKRFRELSAAGPNHDVHIEPEVKVKVEVESEVLVINQPATSPHLTISITSLMTELSAIGHHVDFFKMSSESVEMCADSDRVLELRLAHILATKKLKMMTDQFNNGDITEANIQPQLDDISKRLKVMEEEAAVRIGEIRHLKTQLEKKDKELKSQETSQLSTVLHNQPPETPSRVLRPRRFKSSSCIFCAKGFH